MQSQTDASLLDIRFVYEPMLAAHPKTSDSFNFTIAGKTMRYPLWISSMTGGTELARKINNNLAQACAEFGLGMGLGSCRPLLTGKQNFADFYFRDVIGEQAPFFANIGLAQLQDLLARDELASLDKIVAALKADGVIVHVNPLQEWFQPEGDRFTRAPIDVIEEFLTKANYPVIVKEVGHGMGPLSLARLMALPLAAIEFGAFGGTNFSYMEAHRSGGGTDNGLIHVGHSAAQMVEFVKTILATQSHIQCRTFIVAGGIKNSLDGYAHIAALPHMAAFGMASEVLKYAQGDYVNLRQFLQQQISNLMMARQFLSVES